jgi:hypothetical protein
MRLYLKVHIHTTPGRNFSALTEPDKNVVQANRVMRN